MQPWFNIYNIHLEYDGPEEPFADPEQFPWTKEFEKNSDAIYNELKQYIKKNVLEGYFITSMVSRKNSWRTISLRTWGIEQYNHQVHFPVTYSLIKKHTQIVSASFNLLEANSKIHPHSGDTNAIYRCHLGLDVPAPAPLCALKVKDEVRGWQNGKWLMFIDAFVHEAYNNAPADRYIFVVDIIRDEYISQKRKICSTVITSLFLQKRWQKYSFLKNLSPSSIKFTAQLLRPVVQLSIRLVNVLKIY